MKKKLIVSLLLVLSGCSWFSDNRIVVKPTRRIDTSSYEFRRVLAIFIKYRFETQKSIEWIMADLALAEYELSLKKEKEK